VLDNKRNAFTMIELVFVIVVLGILAAVAIPRFAATRTDAEISKGRADIASIRSAIVSDRQTRLVRGITTFIPAGNAAGQLDDGGLFGGALMYPINGGGWSLIAYDDVNTTTYNYNASSINTTFTYTSGDGLFDCVRNTGRCNDLVD